MLLYGLIGGAALIALILIVAITFRTVVPTNMVHIVQSSKSTVSYGAGRPGGNTYYEWPSWIPIIGVVTSKFPESVFDISLKGYEAYDVGRLPFVVDVTAFFRISDSQKAAQRVASFAELSEQLNGVLQGAVRRILAINKLEETMENRGSLGDSFTEEVDKQLTEWGVGTVKTIEFMDIRDSAGSKVIANIMAKEQSRIDQESRIAVAENHRKAQEAEIIAQQTVDIRAQEAEQLVGIRTAEKEKAVGIASEQSHQAVQAEAKTTAEREMEVVRVRDTTAAEIKKQVQVVDANAYRETSVVKAEADKDVQIVKSEGDKESVIRIAEGNLQSTLKNAEGVQALGEATGKAETAKLMAPVTAQTQLAKEIGGNQGYQTYLISVRQVEAGETVGVEMAKAIAAAEIKVIANSGNIQDGVAGVSSLFTPTGGTNLAGMVAALAQTDEGKALVAAATSRLNG